LSVFARRRRREKCLLGLELTDPGFEASVLSEFRSRLVSGGTETEQKRLVVRRRQRTDSTHVLGAVRALNRLGCAIETLRAALNALAVAAPGWLRAHADPAWAERYAKPADEVHIPQDEAARRACAEQIGRDGHALLAAITAPDAPTWLREVPTVDLLRRVWVQNFYLVPADAVPAGGIIAADEHVTVRWRTTDEGIPSSLLMIASPYDPDVHYAKQHSTTWIGYKVHLTETCDDERPHLITHVETTPAPVVDHEALGRVHAALGAQDLLPGTHPVDAGYVDADQQAASVRDHGVALVGPTPRDHQWQARTDGAFTLQDFRLDRDLEVAICPAGHTSQSWTADHNQGGRWCGSASPAQTARRAPSSHAAPLGPAPAHAVAARGACGSGGGSSPRGRSGVCGRAPPPCRHRGHVVARRAGHEPAPRPLHRAGQDAPPARAYSSGDQPCPPRCMARRQADRAHAPVRLHPPHGPTHLTLTTSPTVVRRETGKE
jgi:hypothetical protein